MTQKYNGIDNWPSSGSMMVPPDQGTLLLVPDSFYSIIISTRTQQHGTSHTPVLALRKNNNGIFQAVTADQKILIQRKDDIWCCRCWNLNVYSSDENEKAGGEGGTQCVGLPAAAASHRDPSGGCHTLILRNLCGCPLKKLLLFQQRWSRNTILRRNNWKCAACF